MGQSFFRFKEFIIHHDKCAMKVGTDAVLLGAWTELKNTKNILDIGTGSGIIALMLAQRNITASISAIDIDEGAVLQASKNFQLSPFASRLNVSQTSLQDYSLHDSEGFDLIVSNPPYFVTSLKCPDAQRSMARHTDTLSLEELIICSKRLLTPEGHLALIIPADLREELLSIAIPNGFNLYRETRVHPMPDIPPKRILFDLSLSSTENPVVDDITIEISRHQYTEDYISLTKDFYLKM